MSANVDGAGASTRGRPAGQPCRRWEAGRLRGGRGLAALGAVLALLLGSGPATATTVDAIPPTGLVIDQPGYYNFTQDLFHGDSRAAIRITASNVVLDLNGYTLYGNFVGVFIIGIQVQTAQAVTVRNGRITGFSNDVRLEDSSNSTIENIAASSFGNHGILLVGSNGNTIQHNTSSRNFDGIRLTNSNSNTIQNNTLSGNYPSWSRGSGITLGASSSNTIRNNTVNSNGRGILLFSGSSNNTIESNIANSNADAGIVLFSSSSNTIRNNTALNNNFSSSGFFKADLYDSNLSTPCVNIWVDNLFVSDNETGADYGPAAGCIRGIVDSTAPTWPFGALWASNVGLTSLTLHWTAAADAVGVTAYRIYRNGALLATVPGTARAQAVPGLSAGTLYSFKVEAGDAAGNWSSNGPSVTVQTLTPQQMIQQIIIDQVNALVAAGVLNQGQGNALIATLQAAIQQLDSGNSATAINQLEAFISQVSGFINADILTTWQGQPLIAAAQEVIGYLGG